MSCINLLVCSFRIRRRYALYYLLREVGTLGGPMGDFADALRAAPSPQAQLRLLNAHRPTALGPGEEEAWDAALYATLDRASLLKRLLRRGADSTPAAAFAGPVAALLPRDRLGALMLDATRRQLARPGDRLDPAGVLHVPLAAAHTECLLGEVARRAAGEALIEALRAMLPQL
jgi:hypothetical protein